MIDDDRRETFQLPVHGDVDASMAFDVLLLCAKTPDFPGLCANLAPLLRPGVEVAAVVNGLPWWFFAGEGIKIHCTDPDHRAASLLEKVTPFGVVVHATAQAVEPGVIHVRKTDRLLFGDAPGRQATHLPDLIAAFGRGGVRAETIADIRGEIWAKLWGNMNMNPISALTQLSSTPILERAELLTLVREMMAEFEGLGRRVGLVLPVSADERIAITRKLGDFRTSMYADAMARRPLECEGILGCVVELGKTLGIATPVSSIVYALLKGLDHSFERRRALEINA